MSRTSLEIGPLLVFKPVTPLLAPSFSSPALVSLLLPTAPLGAPIKVFNKEGAAAVLSDEYGGPPPPPILMLSLLLLPLLLLPLLLPLLPTRG
jgi:hypothetical protein